MGRGRALGVLVLAAALAGPVGACADDGAESQAVDVSLAPGQALDADAVELDLLVEARYCSSGQPATGRLRHEVRTSADVVEVTVIERAPDGAHTCVGSPPTPYAIVLDEPLGDRELLGVG